MTHGKTYNKSPRRINHKATKSKTNTGTTTPELPAEQTTGGGGAKHPISQLTSLWVPMPLPIQKHTKTRFAQRPPPQPTHQSENTKTKPTTTTNKDEHSWPIPPYARVNENQ